MFVPKEGDSSINWSEFFRIGVKLNLERAESVQTRFKGEVSVQSLSRVQLFATP